ncbi:MAG TPA: DoxX family protein [Streptosporangiaceae bacterium]
MVRTAARPMLASIFVLQGYDTFRRPERVAAKAERVVRPAAGRVPGVPESTEQAVRLNGAVQVVAGSMLAAGVMPRLSASAIAATLVPTTLAGHRFWEESSEQDRAQQRIQFLKNLAMLGGLLLAVVDTAGSPSLLWRGRHAAKDARRDARIATQAAKATARATSRASKARKRRSR